MSNSLRLLIAILLSFLVANPALAGKSKEEARRKGLLDKLGLEPAESAPVPEGEEEPAAEEESGEEADGGAEVDEAENEEGEEPSSSGGVKQKPQGGAVTFAPRVHAMLMKRCQRCHQPDKRAGQKSFALVGDPVRDYEAVLTKVNEAAPLSSALLTKATTLPHKKPPITAGGADYRLLEAWLKGGAKLGAAKAAPPPAETKAEGDAPKGPAKSGGKKPKRRPGNKAGSGAAVIEATPETAAPSPAQGALESGPFFDSEIHELLIRGCRECHAPGEMGADSGYAVLDDASSHYEVARRFVSAPDPGASRLFTAARGDGHDGDVVFADGTPELSLLKAWIANGAPRAASGAAGEGTGMDVAIATPPAASSDQPLISPAPVLEKLAELSPLLGGISLHGMFDLNYERRSYTGNPLADGAENVIRSYHHFLFLGRHTSTDPVGLDVELTSLQFWELSLRYNVGPVVLGAKAGKLLVPFGGEPLYHHSYGGLAGFDQKVLPAVWAQEGARAFARFNVAGLTLSGDAYVVRGYNLRGEDAVLNLQSDFSPLETVKPAVGTRLGLAFGPVSMWYSSYLNPLDYDRLLFMQAFDVGVWRMRGVPVLDGLAVSLGAMRADLSGGGPGKDYFHFASYFQVRYYVLDGLYFQYRQGLRTHENKGGLWLDERRLTSDDASSHNIGVVGTWRGLTVGFYHFWNLEKVDEVDDDFFRAKVSYAF